MGSSVEDIIKAVQRQFGDDTGAQIIVDDIYRWINEGQLQISRRIGDNVVPGTPIPTVIGTHQYDLPADFFKMQWVELDGKRLQIVSIQQMYALFPELDSSSGTQSVPKFFATSISSTDSNRYRLTLAPKPGAVGSITFAYNRRPPIITSSEQDLSIPVEYYSTLETFCIAKAKQMDGDDQGAALLASQFKTEVHEDSHDAKHKDEDTYPMIRSSPGDWY